ncbi:MAG TPA: hypothetical protein PLQ43_09195, partial [Deltaproteobacteria bacterium]|nr:hypothetical protein [Deltaproteobacteria bacterium]
PQACSVCGTHEAVDSCRECGASLCRKCRVFEVGRAGKDEVEVVAFCPACFERLANHRKESLNGVFGLRRITDLVNQDRQQKIARFKIKLTS